MSRGSQYSNSTAVKTKFKTTGLKTRIQVWLNPLTLPMVQSDFCRRIITKVANRDSSLKDNIYTIAKLTMMIGQYQ